MMKSAGDESVDDESADDDERQQIKAVKKKSQYNDGSVYTEQVPTNSDIFT